jgi:hypothetical protein
MAVLRAAVNRQMACRVMRQPRMVGTARRAVRNYSPERSPRRGDPTNPRLAVTDPLACRADLRATKGRSRSSNRFATYRPGLSRNDMQLRGGSARPRVRWLAPRQPQSTIQIPPTLPSSRTRNANRRGRRLAARGGACAPQFLLHEHGYGCSGSAHLDAVELGGLG